MGICGQRLPWFSGFSPAEGRIQHRGRLTQELSIMNFIPLITLPLVVYPGESVNLHIKEEPFLSLVQDANKEEKPFGMAPLVRQRSAEYGTLVRIREWVNTHADASVDLRIQGEQVIRILEEVEEIPEKSFGGAIVQYPHNVMDKGDSRISEAILQSVQQMLALLGVSDKLVLEGVPKSYEIAHYVGFSLEEEYEILQILTEIQRLEYIRRHLHQMQEVVDELERIKARVQFNGHFRHISSRDLDP